MSTLNSTRLKSACVWSALQPPDVPLSCKPQPVAWHALQALELLTQVCRQVQPVMRKHSWECRLVTEFIPTNNRYTI